MNLKKIIAAASLVAASATSYAVPITGTLDFGGTLNKIGADTNLDGKVDYLEADSVKLTNYFLAGTDTYAGLSGFSLPAGTPITTVFSEINLNSALAANPLWEVTDGSSTYSFVADTLSVDLRTADDLQLSGSGWLFATGYDKTFGYWDFSSQGGGSFSADAHVPEPGTLALLGLGLAGLGMARRKQAK